MESQVNDTGPYEGRVEICLHGKWSVICDDQLSLYASKLVCAQLGYPREGFTTIGNMTLLIIDATMSSNTDSAVVFGDAAFGRGSGSML